MAGMPAARARVAERVLQCLPVVADDAPADAGQAEAESPVEKRESLVAEEAGHAHAPIAALPSFLDENPPERRPLFGIGHERQTAGEIVEICLPVDRRECCSRGTHALILVVEHVHAEVDARDRRGIEPWAVAPQ